MKKMGRVLKREMKTMSRVKTGSILRSASYDDMKAFKWERLTEELKMHAPLFYSVLNSCTSSKRQRSNKNAIVGVCASILLKYRCPEMSFVQKMVMLLLHASHCGKQVKRCNNTYLTC
jgi:hypothetical protein